MAYFDQVTIGEPREHPPVGSTSPYDFYHQCYDAVLALSISLNKTIGGMCIIYVMQLQFLIYIPLRIEYQRVLEGGSKRASWTKTGSRCSDCKFSKL